MKEVPQAALIFADGVQFADDHLVELLRVLWGEVNGETVYSS